MGIPNLYLCAAGPKQSHSSMNEFGETPLAYAPTIRLANGEEVVPQQYMNVDRTLNNLANVLTHIAVPKGYQLFAGQDDSCLFVIVGVVGKENYPGSAEIAQRDKMVYGRRWLIEPTTPTSEIVQTSMLAIKKVREHEVRELLTVSIDGGRRRTTPFNCHLDLPLLVGNQAALYGSRARVNSSALSVEAQLKALTFAGYKFEINQQVTLGDKQLYELMLVGKSTHFPELANSTIALVCEHPSQQDLLHQLIAALILSSDRYVEEHFAFKGFKRFSHNVDPIGLAKFSYETRNVETTDPRFDRGFEAMSYDVDASKAPVYNNGELGRQQRALVSSYDNLGGYLPLEK
jgi:hypothetical protein